METITFLITMLLSLAVVCSVICNTYLLAKMKKTPPFNAYILIQGLMIIWMIFRLAERYAPTQGKLFFCILIQNLALFPIPFLGLYLYTFISQTTLSKKFACFLSGLLSLMIFIFSQNARGTFFYFSTPAILCLLLSLVGFSVVKHKLFKQSDPTLISAIKSIGGCILILDTKKNIMDANFSFFQKLMSKTPPETLMEFIKLLTAYIPEGMPQLEFEKESEFKLVYHNKMYYYTVRSTPLYNNKNINTGEIITFHDMTQYKNLIHELGTKKDELTQVNEKLKDYLLVVDELEEANEKKDIILRIQDSIGHKIMELLVILEVARIKSDENNTISTQELEHAITTCGNVIKEIRSSVSILMQEY